MSLGMSLVSLTAACLLGSASPVAAQTWRGLRLVPESRCSPYRASDYSYPQSQDTGFLRSEVSSGRGYGPAGVRVRFPYISLTGVESGKQEWTRVQCATAKSGKESGPKLRKSCAITMLG